jgi:hypothetical protein
MSIETFRASKMPVLDLGAALQDCSWDGEPRAPGLVYCGSLYIDFVQPHWPENARREGQYHLLIGRDEWITDDLNKLETLLYAFARGEGYVDRADTLDSLVDEYTVFNRGNHLDLGSADEHRFDESLTVEQRVYVNRFCDRWEAAAREEATNRAIARRVRDEGITS